MKPTKLMNATITNLDQLVRVDMHVHVDRKMDRDLIIKVLKEAEKNGVKVLSFVMHNDIYPYTDDSPLMKLISEGEIKQYYTGKIVTGVELDCLVDGVENYSSNGYDFNGDTIHILMYDFDVKEMTRAGMFYNERTKRKNFNEDIEILKSELNKNYRFKIPEDMKFVYKVDYQQTLYNYLQDFAHDKVKQSFIKKLNVEPEAFDSKSKFARLLTTNSNGAISKFFNSKQKSLLRFRDIEELATQAGGWLVLAHPAKMNDKYNIKDYMETILRNYGWSFYGIEMKYGLDNFQTTKEVFKAFYDINKNNEFYWLKMTGGSECLTYLPTFSFGGKKWTQSLGKKIASALNEDGANEFIVVPKCDVDNFKGIYSGHENEIDDEQKVS